MTAVHDIFWYDDHEAAQKRARAEGKPLLIKPLDQGYVSDQHWCPAASLTRATALSDPEVATFVHMHFVAVRAGLWERGLFTNPEGRQLTLETSPSPLWFQGVIVADADGEWVGQTAKEASPRETREELERLLRTRPEWAARLSPLSVYDESDPDQAELVRLDRSFADLSPEERAATRPRLEDWLERHPSPDHPAAALARVLLGEALFNGGEHLLAEARWQEVMETFGDHPLRHRAYYHLIDPQVWPVPEHPHLRHAPLPGPGTYPTEVPDRARLAKNREAASSDPRYRTSPSGIPFVRVDPGTFRMGGQPGYFANESPVRTVTLTKGFWLAAWPVTRRLWNEFEPGRWPATDDPLSQEVPATRIDREDALVFIDWLADRDGLPYRLPTEAEWEYAARGGLEGKAYPWGDEEPTPDRCNYDRRRPVPVGCYAPNGYGLFDMVGNTFEWCADRYFHEEYARTPASVVDPEGPPADVAPRRVWTVRASGCGSPFAKVLARISWRVGFDVSHGATGLRLAVDAPPDRSKDG